MSLKVVLLLLVVGGQGLLLATGLLGHAEGGDMRESVKCGLSTGEHENPRQIESTLYVGARQGCYCCSGCLAPVLLGRTPQDQGQGEQCGGRPSMRLKKHISVTALLLQRG